MEQTVKMNHLLVLSEQLYKRISESENKTPYAFNLLDLAGVNEPFTSLILAHIGPRGIVRGGRMPLPNQRT